MPALVAGIQVLTAVQQKHLDGRDKPAMTKNVQIANVIEKSFQLSFWSRAVTVSRAASSSASDSRVGSEITTMRRPDT